MADPRSTGDLPVPSSDISTLLNFLWPLPSLPVEMIAVRARLQDLLLPSGASSSLPSPSASPLQASGASYQNSGGEDCNRFSHSDQQPHSSLAPVTGTFLQGPPAHLNQDLDLDGSSTRPPSRSSSGYEEDEGPDKDLGVFPETASLDKVDKVDKLIWELLEEGELDKEFPQVKPSLEMFLMIN